MHRNSFFDAIEDRLLQVLFEHLSDLRPSLTFVDVGAYDGVTSSQTHALATTRGWKGLVIEPAPHAFAALTKTYEGVPAIRPINCAVAEADGTLPFYCVTNKSWEGMLSSLDRQTILQQRALFPDIEEQIVEIDVAVRTLASICRDNDVSSLDLLKVDAEGRDDSVVRSLDLAATRPTLIVFEHKLIPTERLQALHRYLEFFGYRGTPLWSNTVYATKDFAVDTCVSALVAHGSDIFPAGRDEVWGNGNWRDAGAVSKLSALRSRLASLSRRA